MNISTIWTKAAITAMKQIKFKKLKSICVKEEFPVHARAPGRKKKWCISQFIGVVIVKTKTTANPSPKAVGTFLDTAKYEHMPKK